MKLNISCAEAFLMVSESACSADMYYATGFLAHDPFVYLNSGSEKLLVSDMELGRAGKESRVTDVLSTSRYSIREKMRKHRDVDAAQCDLITEFLSSENMKRIAVPYDFPVQLADCMKGL